MSAGDRAPCRTCKRVFVSDGTPLAEDGYCMWCRVGVPIVCDRCGAACAGTHLGILRCLPCRSVRLGEQQYEDKQNALLARLREQGLVP